MDLKNLTDRPADNYRALMDADTGAAIGSATTAQAEASDEACPAGIITIDQDGDVVAACDCEQAVRTRGAVLRRVYVEADY